MKRPEWATGTRRRSRRRAVAVRRRQAASLFLRLEEEFFVWNLPEKSTRPRMGGRRGEGVRCDVTAVHGDRERAGRA